MIVRRMSRSSLWLLSVADRQGEFIQTLNAPEGNRFAVLFTFAEGNGLPIEHEEISDLFAKALEVEG